MTSRWMVAVFGVALGAACSTSATVTGPGGGDGGNVGQDSLGLCSATSPCPTGEFCFDGLCAYGCTNDANCAANQYCDTGFSKTCQNKQGPSGCTGAGDCAKDQTCVNGLCSTPPPNPPPAACTPPPGANDGCDEGSLCIAGQQGQANKCMTFPPCGQDGSCPVGNFGALCNDGYIQGKGRFCMPGLCKDQKNCPSGNACVPLQQGAPVGACSNGGTGQPCDAAHACQSGLTCQTVPGFSGICMPGGFGFDGGF